MIPFRYVLCFLLFVVTLPASDARSAGTPVAAPHLPTCGPQQSAADSTPRPNNPIATPTDTLQQVADIPLPGGTTRFDYQSFDPTAGRLYIAHMGDGELVVVDTKTQSVVGTVPDLPSVTGVLAVPALHRVYASVSDDHNVAVIDDRSLQVVARLGKIGFPDGLAYAPQTNQIFVSDESGGGEVVLDAQADTVITTIDLGGEAGNSQYDPGSGCVLVAVHDPAQLVVLDPTTDSVVGNVDLGPDCAAPHGFQIDAVARLAFVTCEKNARLLVLNLHTMQVTDTQSVGEDPDVVAWDAGLGRLYVASESGTVSIFQERGETLQPVDELTIPHAHSVAVDPDTHLVYLPLENIDGHPVLRVMTP
jgi:DNA-binding beta-propeller fold protein YncE